MTSWVSGIKADCICACRYFGACAATLSGASRIPVGVTAAIVLLAPHVALCSDFSGTREQLL